MPIIPKLSFTYAVKACHCIALYSHLSLHVCRPTKQVEALTVQRTMC